MGIHPISDDKYIKRHLSFTRVAKSAYLLHVQSKLENTSVLNARTMFLIIVFNKYTFTNQYFFQLSLLLSVRGVNNLFKSKAASSLFK